MAYDPNEVDGLIRMVKRRVRAFGWEVDEAVSLISDAVKRADAKGMTFSQTQCAILEVLEQSYEEWDASDDEDEPQQVAN
jgi:hypothetical protein